MPRKRSIGSDIVLNETINSKGDEVALLEKPSTKIKTKVDSQAETNENLQLEAKPVEKASTTVASATITNVSSML